jgi:glycosyltransferase involved in cell wall biosynthesis
MAQLSQSLGSDLGTKVLFCAMKNEGPFVLEWVAYHLAIGFDRIIIFSNDSDDGTTEVLDALAANGYIEHYTNDVPAGVAPQISASRQANARKLFRDGDWVIWLDADEFLNVKTGNGSVDDLIATIGTRKGALIHWRIFGDGGNAVFPGRFVSSDFTGTCPETHPNNRSIKTFFQFGPAVAGLGTSGIHRPKLVADNDLSVDDWMNGRGQSLRNNRMTANWLKGADSGGNHSVAPNDMGFGICQINHYCVRTPDHYRLKKARGRGWAAQSGEANTRHTDDFYQQMNTNVHFDDTILRHKLSVDRCLSQMLSVPAIVQASAETARLTDAALAALPPVSQVADKATARFAITLPAPEQDYVMQCYGDASVVLEYGGGGSTFAACDQGVRKVVAVEGDKGRADKLQSALTDVFPDVAAHVHYVDIGPVRVNGMPLNNRFFARFPGYANSVWDMDDFTHPDVVLLNGRFRAACLCTCVLRAQKPLRVLFADYGNRPQDHWIDRLVSKATTVGDMAVFEITPNIDFASHLDTIVRSYTDAR